MTEANRVPCTFLGQGVPDKNVGMRGEGSRNCAELSFQECGSSGHDRLPYRTQFLSPPRVQIMKRNLD